MRHFGYGLDLSNAQKSRIPLTLEFLEIIKMMDKLTAQQKNNRAILHALNVRAALSMKNYDAFFKLYSIAPNMGKYLLSHMTDRERVNAVSQICKAYRPSVPLHFLTRHLGFISPNEIQHSDKNALDAALTECFKWISAKKAVAVQNKALEILDTPNILIDTKQSFPIFTQHVIDFKRKGVDLKGQIH